MTELETSIERLVARDQDMIACPYPLFDELREQPPAYSPALDAFPVTRFEDVRKILHDTDTWSSLMPTGPTRGDSSMTKAMTELMAEDGMAEVFAAVMSDRRTAAVLLNADPPDHVRQRKAVNRAFRPGRIRAMEPLVKSVSDQLMAKFADRGSVEFVAEYAVGLPLTIIADALGVADGDLQQFKIWSDDLVMPVGNSDPSVDQVRGFLLSTRDFGNYMSELIADRQANPQDDVLSDVANAEVDGQELSEAEKISMLTQFLVAGNETTTKLLTNIARHLATNPELQDRVRADRSLVDGVVEEALRFEAPVGGLYRTAKVDTVVDGTTIKEGQHVWILYGAANRDSDAFAEPDRFDPARENVRDHLSFGHGEHFCIGAGLARMEGVVATNAILDNLANLRLSTEHEEAFEDSFVLRGLRTLLLDFDVPSGA